MAQAVNISIGFLSNLERAQSTPSVAIMRKLTQYYGLNISTFSALATRPRPWFDPATGGSCKAAKACKWSFSRPAKSPWNPIFFAWLRGRKAAIVAHEGEEFLYVTRGQLVIFLRMRNTKLHAGDSFYFESKTPHLA